MNVARPDGPRGDARAVLRLLAAGEIGVEAALESLRPFTVLPVGDIALLDVDRLDRKGVPEVVYARRKSDDALVRIVAALLDRRGCALVSRLSMGKARRLQKALGELGRDSVFEYDRSSSILVATAPGYQAPPERGCIGVLTAGTSDIPVAEEAATVARHMGCRVEKAYDVGVAGIHRLADPLVRMLEASADALVVVAGMEGALPSVVAGLVDIPVIGVPTSTGYGFGGDGTGALCSILQSCSPGLVAVNVDNGVGAGAVAALIARRCARP